MVAGKRAVHHGVAWIARWLECLSRRRRATLLPWWTTVGIVRAEGNRRSLGCIPLARPPRTTPATHSVTAPGHFESTFPKFDCVCLWFGPKELKEGGRGARKSAPSHACFFSSLMALRVNIKDLGGSGFDAHTTQLNKKKGLQPPLGASPGELRLWRKLSGLLTDDEKKVERWSTTRPSRGRTWRAAQGIRSRRMRDCAG